eukprot:scaffold13236_cov82-Cyclotella_meneghiniana.AAC.8
MPWIQLTGSKKVELCDLQTEMKKLSPAVHLREVIRIEDTAVLGSMWRKPNTYHASYSFISVWSYRFAVTSWIVAEDRRAVDDGRFRRNVCEALFFCYVLQAIAVLRAQFTDRSTAVNWIAITLLSLMGFGYGRFRFGKGGDLIKVYELPQNNKVTR